MKKSGVYLLFLCSILLLLTAACNLLYPPGYFESIVDKNNMPSAGGPTGGSSSSFMPQVILYVSSGNGNDTNAGTDPGYPLKNLQTALDKRIAYGNMQVEIRMEAGIYSPGNGLCVGFSGIIISNSYAPVMINGGFDPGFVNNLQKSTLDGGGLSAFVTLSNCSYVGLMNLVLSNGYTSDPSGCSAFYTYYASDIFMVNSEIRSNTGGSAVKLEWGERVELDDVIINQNTAMPAVLIGNSKILNYCSINNNSITTSNTVIDVRSSGDGTNSIQIINCNIDMNPINAGMLNPSIIRISDYVAGLMLISNNIGGNNDTNSLIYSAASFNNLIMQDNTLVLDRFRYIYNDPSGTRSIGNMNYLPDLTNIYTGCVFSGNKVSYTKSFIAVNNNSGINDTNASGSTAYPFKSIQSGLETAAVSGINEVRVSASGPSYTPGNGLNASGVGVNFYSCNNIKLAGGYDSSTFTIQSGITRMDGLSTLSNIISAQYCDNIEINGFSIENGSNLIGNGGGLYWYYVNNSVITNCIISNNYSGGNGGGFAINSSSQDKIFVDFILNKAASVGGAMYWNGGSDIYFSGLVSTNTAQNTAAFYVYNSGNSTIANSCFSNNGVFGADCGAVQYNYCNIINFFNNVVTNNHALTAYVSQLYFNTGCITLTLTNNKISADGNPSACAIRSEGYINYLNISLNKFYTNTMAYMFRDYNSTNIACDANWVNINNASYYGAYSASGNTVLP